MTRLPGHTEQTAMHPAISYYLTQARTAGLGRHAQRDALARLSVGAARLAYARGCCAGPGPYPAAPRPFSRCCRRRIRSLSRYHVSARRAPKSSGMAYADR